MGTSRNDAGQRPQYEYNEYPKSLAPDDFWGQVRRTRYGKPISEEDVRIIVDTIARGLDLVPGDVLLDLACGNGALSSRLFDSCRAFLGVDASEYLIRVAKDNFERLPDYEFRVEDVAQFVRAEPEPERFSKVLCYASFAYLSRDTAAAMLSGLCERFLDADTIFIGNVPDKSRAHLYYEAGSDYADQISDPTSQIGIWWSQSELADFAAARGWSARFQRMPEHVFNAIYRYDAILTRR